MDEKYWQDYTKFIKLSEEITGRSPAALLEHYKTLVEELENDNYELEWVYEKLENQKTFQKIHQLLHSNELKSNLLKQSFENETALLDDRIKPFLKEHLQNNPDWKAAFNPDDLNV